MKNDYARLLIAATLSALLLLGTGIISYGRFSGSWENELHLSPEAKSLLSFDSSLGFTYSKRGWNLASVSQFEEDHFKNQKFEATIPSRFFDTRSTLALNPSSENTPNLDYWLTRTGFGLGQIDLDQAFLVEYLERESTYGSGYKFSLSGQLGGGSRIYVENYFGMEENVTEALGLESGSGYSIVTQGGDYNPSAFQYVETRAEITGLEFGCCQFRPSVKLSQNKGLEYIIVESEMESESWPLKLDAEARLTPRDRSLKLKPRLMLNWGCLDVYTRLQTPGGKNHLTTGQNETVSGLGFDGFGITGVNFTGLSFSSLTALQGKLFRLQNESDIDVRADDYVLNPDPIFSNLYTETKYDGVLTVEKSNGELPLKAAVDLYFNTSSREGFFDFGLFTGSLEYSVQGSFCIGAGVEFKSDALEKFRLSFDYSFSAAE